MPRPIQNPPNPYLTREVEWLGPPTPARRFLAMRTLTAAGVPCGLASAPLIPGLNDDQIPAVLEAAKAAGAERAFLAMLRLPVKCATSSTSAPKRACAVA